jgi:diguanylate cyclase (GGDEF)-like protein
MVKILFPNITGLGTSVLEEHAPVDFDLQRRMRIVGTVMVFFTALTFLFSIDSVFQNDFFSAVFLAVLTAINVIGLRWHFNKVSQTISQWLAALTMFSLFFHSLLSGGSHSLSTFWGLAIIASCFYILGYRRGLICTAIILGFTAVLMYGMANDRVQTTFLTDNMSTFSFRFISAMVLIATFALLQEYDRSRVVKNLLLSREQMRRLASTDELTGLANRRTMAEQLRQQERRCNEQHEQYSVILCDIDRFKRINDIYGHEVGDKVITAVAQVLKDNLREFDTVARWGGEEFLVMLPRTSIDGATQVADKLQEAFNNYHISHENAEIKPTMSFGVASADADIHVDECVRQADRRLYKAKHLGRNCVVAKDTHDEDAA